MKPIKLTIKTNAQNYPILIGHKLLSKISKIMKDNYIEFEKCLLVTDKKVPKKLVNQIIKSFKNKKIFFNKINANEKNKNQKTVNSILKTLLDKNFSRNDCLISIGGGITGDVSGFAASMFKRGMQFVNIPTTLLSQVDSSIGGKTGVNTSHGKNLIGSFYQPKLVISDIEFLKSLNKREIICGYGEILKHSIISNRKFFKYLDQNYSNILDLKSPFIEKAIYLSCKVKQSVVEKDEKEINSRKVLNFGHTFAHAFEASLGYSRKLNHGEAVILGIQAALKFSYKNKFLKINDFKVLMKHIEKPELPSNIKKYFSLKDINKIIEFMMIDKKNNSNRINLVLLRNIGNPLINQKFNKDNLRFFLKKKLLN